MRLFSFVSIAYIVVVAASNAIELTTSNFDSVVGKGKPVLVQFYTPWCAYCKTLGPIYEQLANSFAHDKDKVIIAKVDAAGNGVHLAERYGVKAYPTIKWFRADGHPAESYTGGRDLGSLSAFVTAKAGIKHGHKHRRSDSFQDAVNPPKSPSNVFARPPSKKNKKPVYY